MTFPKMGSRLLRVGDVVYIWRIRKKPTYDQGIRSSPMTVAIRASGPAGRSVLVVNLGVSRPDNWVCPHQTALTPALVRDIIRQAIISGWAPQTATQPFKYEYPLILDRA